MKAAAYQETRTLKIEIDPWVQPVKPKIRLTGRWLERAGFKPGHRVEIHFPEPGTLTLRFVELPDVGGTTES
jgi:hypothetical protein